MKDISMKEIFENSKRKKISYDINEKSLEMIDEMASIMGITRSKIFDALVFSGIKAQVNFNLKTWESMKKDKKYEDRKWKIEELIKKLQNFKKKWTIDDIPS